MPTRIPVRVIPNASKTELIGYVEGAWKIRLAAPPVEGRANEELVRFLSALLDIPKTSIEIAKGSASKTKMVRVPLSEEIVKQLLKI